MSSGVAVDWGGISGAQGYQIFATTDYPHDFPSTFVAQVAGAQTGVVLPPGSYGLIAVSTLLVGADGQVHNVLSHPLTNPIVSPLQISTTSLPPATVGQAYFAQLQATGGTPSYSWTLQPGPTGFDLPTPLKLSSTGAITGIPIAAGTSTFGVTVIDSTAVPQQAQATFSIVVNASAASPTFPLTYGGGQVLVNPRLAIVLVDPNSPQPSWWSSMSNPSSEQTAIVAATRSLVTTDYSSSYDIALSNFFENNICIFGVCTHTDVGRGLTLCNYRSGSSWYGPISSGSATSTFIRQTIVPQLAGPCGRNVTNTVFLLVFAPPALVCVSENGKLVNGSANGSSGGIHTALIYLEDSNNARCANDLPLPPESSKVQQAVDFATFDESHEVDEVITNPQGNTGGWAVGNGQIADSCGDRDKAGAIQGSNLSFFNYTRDQSGTVVSAYVGNVLGEPNSGSSYPCLPDVSTGLPPQ